MVELLYLAVFGDFEHFFFRFVYNIDYILKVLVVGFAFYVGFDFINVCLQFINYSVAVSDPAI